MQYFNLNFCFGFYGFEKNSNFMRMLVLRTVVYFVYVLLLAYKININPASAEENIND